MTRRKLAAATAFASSFLMVITLACSVATTGSDTDLMLDPTRALALPPGSAATFRYFLLADSFGYYLLFLLFGVFLWSRLRAASDWLLDGSIVGLACYALLGIAGTSIQFAIHPVLSQLYATGDAAQRTAAEASWLTTVWGSQKGLWLMEGPTFGFWALVTGAAMRRIRLPFGGLLMGIGALYALMFVVFVLGATGIGDGLVLVAVLLLPVWTVLCGIAQLRERPA